MCADLILAAVFIGAMFVCTAAGVVAGFSAGVAFDAAVGFKPLHARGDIR